VEKSVASSPERFGRVQELFHAALHLPPAARQAFLENQCFEDASLRQEIESLLAEDAHPSGFVQTGFGADPPSTPESVFASGTRLGCYEISAKIGAGGMGEVYRARDIKLRRDVAVKVLPRSFANDSERISRFEREAQLLASLNHPHIAVIYGMEESNGSLALVMELVEGPTLAERIASGPLPLEEAVGLAKQIAEALEAAHERGIVHRDLKPANVKITPAGVVKVLDFGLGKVLKADGTPTETRTGMIVGTAAYMPPEQARGAAIDKRADIWAFGVVLCEMLTGRRPFEGDSVADVLASMVKDQPDLSAVPPGMTAVVSRCLSKEPRNRWGSMGDVRWALDALPVDANAPAPARRTRYLLWAAAALLALGACGALLWRAKPSQPLFQMEITAPEGTTLGPVGWGQVALSPDGRRLAFSATSKDGGRRLWLRSLDSGTPTPLVGTENVALFPVWSPDSRWLGFSANGKFQKIDVIAGGPPELICECVASAASWNFEGTILFASRDQPLHRVSASGGKPAPMFDLDASRGETWQGASDFLPDGKHFIYDSIGKERGSVLASLDGKTRRFLLPIEDGVARYAPNNSGSGWLLYVKNQQLFARPIDPNKMQLTGESVLVANSVGSGPSFSVSANGLLAFRHVRRNPSQLTWFDRAGTQLSGPGESGTLKYPRISPDQRTVAFVSTEAGNTDVWLLDINRNKVSRFTSDTGLDDYPVWSSDSSQIIYLSVRGNERLLVERPVEGVGPERLLLKTPGTTSEAFGLLFLSKLPTGLSPDGRWVLASEWMAASGMVWMIPVQGSSEPMRVTEGADATVSPNGRWLLYATGGPVGRLGFASSRPQVFVESLSSQPGGSRSSDRRWQISTAGGANPVWRGDGKEIFYLALDGKMMSVPVEAGENSFLPGAPRPLFQTRLVPGGFREYDVTRDGKRFLLNVPIPDTGEEPITVIVNWPKLLEK
jgi:dipeptidyl aminopeptidase/acylaminoacyl peptidase